mgnify:CR=1 FL=1
MIVTSPVDTSLILMMTALSYPRPRHVPIDAAGYDVLELYGSVFTRFELVSFGQNFSQDLN